MVLFLLILLIIVNGCANSQNGDGLSPKNAKSKEIPVLAKDLSIIHVDMLDTAGKKIGTASLEELDSGVKITITASNLSKGTHGFHIHEKGLCEPPGFESAGGHFNPEHSTHGFNNPGGPHAGDLPNLEVGEDGSVTESFIAELVTLKKGESNSLLREGGTSLMIHADPDDNISQPAGDSGARIACGVIAK